MPSRRSLRLSPRSRLLQRVRRAVSRPQPLLSVVVPVYAVERYLPETLDNLTSQTHRNVEIVVVDDGSPDRCADIAREWAARDARVRLVQQENAGPSAARNHGVSVAHGEYLTFADGDDLLPADAWERMVGSLERTGSDFVVGRLERDNGVRRWATPRMRRNHEHLREGITVADLPGILADVFPVNKVYRREAWDRWGLRFPEGLFYEDQPVMSVGFLRGRFDVLPETVYWYRVRDDGSSTTQRRHRIGDLQDRIVTKQMTVDSVEELASPEVRTVFYADVLPADMWEYFRAAVAGDEDYWRLVREMLQRFWHPGTVPFERTQVPAQQRLMGWLVAQDRRADLEALIAWLDHVGPRRVTVDGEELLDHPWRHEAGLPPECTQIRLPRP